MRPLTRRDVLLRWGAVSAGAVSMGFAGMRLCTVSMKLPADATGVGYGELVRDRRRRVDLPRGFSYRVISQVGETMDDGLVVPGSPDHHRGELAVKGCWRVFTRRVALRLAGYAT